KGGYVYFLASPDNATQKYLYRARLNGKGQMELLTPATLKGTHNYSISPNAKFARHTYSNTYTKSATETITLPKHQSVKESESIAAKISKLREEQHTEFFKVTIDDGVELDGWMVKPAKFDPAR